MALLAWIGMAMAVPATVAFTASPPPAPPPSDPPPALTQPVVAMTPAPAAPAAPSSLPPTPPKGLPQALPALPATLAPALPALPATLAPALPALPATLPQAHPAALPMPDRDVRRIVVDAALTKVGAPYAWAATGPDAFDCSGLIVWAFRQAGLTMPRSSQALAAGGTEVPRDQMQPGDVIILFPDASHAGIYVGGGRMIHAQFEGLPVIVESLRRAPINTVRRYA